jgi:hypothetical protein
MSAPRGLARPDTHGETQVSPGEQPGGTRQLAPPGSPNIDILVIDERETVTAAIQAKARTPGVNLGWPLNKSHLTIRPFDDGLDADGDRNVR